MAENLILLSHPTYNGPSGATAAATYSFFTSDYQPPAQERYIDNDVVKNQHGIFKYLYDNGPGFKKFPPFSIICENTFTTRLGASAAEQYARLVEMWNYRGALGLQTPDGVHTVHWAGDHERSFRVFPRETTSLLEFKVVVQFEEAQ